MVWAPDYVTATDLKDYLEVRSADDDAWVALWASAASRNVDEYCGRQFGKPDTTVTRYYQRPVWDRREGAYVYTIDDVYDLTGLAVTDDDGEALTDFTTEPLNAVLDGRPVERLLTSATCGRIGVTTDRFGWDDPPPSIKIGLVLMAARLAARRGSPFGVAGSPSDGSEIRLLARLDPDMITVLKPFRRTWWAT